MAQKLVAVVEVESMSTVCTPYLVCSKFSKSRMMTHWYGNLGIWTRRYRRYWRGGIIWLLGRWIDTLLHPMVERGRQRRSILRRKPRKKKRPRRTDIFRQKSRRPGWNSSLKRLAASATMKWTKKKIWLSVSLVAGRIFILSAWNAGCDTKFKLTNPSLAHFAESLGETMFSNSSALIHRNIETKKSNHVSKSKNTIEKKESKKSK